MNPWNSDAEGHRVGSDPAELTSAEQSGAGLRVARRWRWFAVSLSALTLAGCPVDERTLVEGTVTRGGTLTGGRGNATSASEAGENGADPEAPTPSSTGGRGSSEGNGAGGNAGDPSELEDAPCPDLDLNAVHDCEETLIANSTFDEDGSHWEPEPLAVATWDKSDARKNRTGSLRVENRTVADSDGNGMAGVRQCVPVTGGAPYRFASQILVSDWQENGYGALLVLFYEEEACTGLLASSYTSNLVLPNKAWKTVVVNQRAPEQAQSVAVRLVAIKPFREASFEAFFDNVLVKEN